MIAIGCTTNKMMLNLLTPKCFHLEIAHIMPRSNIIVMYFLRLFISESLRRISCKIHRRITTFVLMQVLYHAGWVHQGVVDNIQTFENA